MPNRMKLFKQECENVSHLLVTERSPKKRGGSLQPVLPLIPEKLPTKEDDKAAFLSFELKMQSDQAENGGIVSS